MVHHVPETMLGLVKEARRTSKKPSTHLRNDENDENDEKDEKMMRKGVEAPAFGA